MPSPRLTRCTCGKNINREQTQDQSVHCLKNVPTRCPCVTNGNACSRECKCKGCQNKEKTSTVQLEQLGKNITSCSCGKAKKKTDPHYKSCVDGLRKSKCSCLKNGLKCSNACDCHNCHNAVTMTSKPTESHEQTFKKRKRVNPSQYKRTKGTQYMESEMAQVPLQGTWTHLETFILVNILSLISTLPFSPTINDIAKLYNYIADYDTKRQRNQDKIRGKSTAQVNGKISNIKKIQETNESLLNITQKSELNELWI